MKVNEEDGQALVLALGFLIFVGLVVGAMLALAYASELSTQRLGDQRNAVYSTDGATDAAIQVGLVDPTIGRYGDARCQATSPSVITPATPVLLTTTSSSNTTANVVCTWSPDPLKVDRDVTFTTFAGQGTPVVQAVVTYHFHLSGAPMTVEVTSWTYCTHGPSC
jgi:hypothetical protein